MPWPLLDIPDAEGFAPPECFRYDLSLAVDTTLESRLYRDLDVQTRTARLLHELPWVRSVGKLELTVQTEGWKFPVPPVEPLTPQPRREAMPPSDASARREAAAVVPAPPPDADRLTFQPATASSADAAAGVLDAAVSSGHLVSSTPQQAAASTPHAAAGALPAAAGEAVVLPPLPDQPTEPKKAKIRPKPTAETVVLKDRLMYLLQPPLDYLFTGKQVEVPFKPFPYQLEGIAFLMPRHAALLADEMGLGKTMQTILSLRLLFHTGMIRKALLICPKPLVYNWCREMKLWAPDLPFEILGGDGENRRRLWTVSQTPLKIVNYETLTRDADLIQDERVAFDVVVLDEAQRIKNRESKTAQVVRSIRRARSWALTGTPIENRPEDLANIFSFIDPDRIPPDTPPKRYPALTSDCILRRVKEDVMTDMPPKFIRDVGLELTPPQKETYTLAEKEGVIRLNELGETITVQHVFQLVMRLKQVCNFDPVTGASAKLEQLLADMQEVADSGRKAIVFSQWVEPLEMIAQALEPFGPLLFHGKIPAAERPAIIDRFRNDPDKHVILMSYGTGSVGLNLQFANYVFLFDRWWNPAIEDQAINRAHRIGQKSPVTVTRFLMENTIEQRIADVLESKRAIFQELLANNGPPPILGLTEEEIFGLFDIRPPRKR